MFLLDALPLLVLPLPEPIKLLLVFLIQRGIDGRFQRRRTVRVGASVARRWIPRLVFFLWVLGGAVWTGESARFHRTVAVKSARARSGSNIWTTVIHGSQQSTV